ncbi:hypothetical protein D3C87_1376220 [compost metagenome]
MENRKEKILQLKKHISENKKEIKEFEDRIAILEKAKEIDAKGMMRVFLNKQAFTTMADDDVIESIRFDEDYCAATYEISLFSEAITTLQGQGFEPVIYIEKV